MPRIVSLIPSATEMVAALGHTAQLVGRSHECDVPAEVRNLPALTASRVNPVSPSPEIDRDVRVMLKQALSIYDLDVDRLRALSPDVVITQTQCEVCAVEAGQVEQALAGWLGNRPQLVSLEGKTLTGVWDDVTSVAASLGASDAGQQVVAGLNSRMGDIARRAADVESRPSVACLEWIEPLMAGGYWIPELVHQAGGISVFGTVGGISPQIDWDDLVSADPEVILVIPCGFDLERTRAEFHFLAGRPGWGDLRAVRGGRVYLADGNRYFNRPGPALVESLEITAELLHPERFDFGHEGSAWERLDA